LQNKWIDMTKRGLCFCVYVGVLPRGTGRAVPKMRTSQCAFIPKQSPKFAMLEKSIAGT